MDYKLGAVVEILTPKVDDCGCDNPLYVDRRPPRYNQGPYVPPSVKGEVIEVHPEYYGVRRESDDKILYLSTERLRYWYPWNK